MPIPDFEQIVFDAKYLLKKHRCDIFTYDNEMAPPYQLIFISSYLFPKKTVCSCEFDKNKKLFSCQAN